jgi:hypothetical protein
MKRTIVGTVKALALIWLGAAGALWWSDRVEAQKASASVRAWEFREKHYELPSILPHLTPELSTGEGLAFLMRERRKNSMVGIENTPKVGALIEVVLSRTSDTNDYVITLTDVDGREVSLWTQPRPKPPAAGEGFAANWNRAKARWEVEALPDGILGISGGFMSVNGVRVPDPEHLVIRSVN